MGKRQNGRIPVKIMFICVASSVLLAVLAITLLGSRTLVRGMGKLSAGSGKVSEKIAGIEKYTLKKIHFSRVSGKKIKIYWEDIQDEGVNCYIVRRRPFTASGEEKKWEIIAAIKPVSGKRGKRLAVTDCLEKAVPQQYEYRVDVEAIYNGQAVLAEGKTVPASNVMVCIDPGHYKGKNKISGKSSFGYAEGDFTLKIALELKRILKRVYGIDSYMTRSSGSITLDGYTDLELDSSHISLRGSYAAKKKSNLFVSLHTNANADYANGYETCMQPLSINKSIIIANTRAASSGLGIKVCNSVGSKLSKVNKGLKLSTSDKFKNGKKNKLVEWTEEYNDALHAAGTVVCRSGSSGDYYGVLRGASEVGIQGMIIEHGLHTVPAVRKAAKEGMLERYWAEADACGIADGFGFQGSRKDFLGKRFLG